MSRSSVERGLLEGVCMRVRADLVAVLPRYAAFGNPDTPGNLLSSSGFTNP